MESSDFQLRHDPKKMYTYFIDGVDRIAYAVTLHGWYWNLIEWLGTRPPYITKIEFFEDVHRLTTEFLTEGVTCADGTFQQEFSKHAMAYADVLLRRIEEDERGYANDPPEGSS